MPLFGSETGRVFIRDFDEAIARALDAEEKQLANGTARREVKIDGVSEDSNVVPVLFETGESTLQDYEIPSIVVNREEMPRNFQWWHPEVYEYTVVADDASQVSVDGENIYDKRERKKRAIAYDFVYTIDLRARYKNPANRMLEYFLRHFKPRSHITVIDSLGDERQYFTEVEGTSNISELSTVSDKEEGYSMTMTIEGELDIHSEQEIGVILDHDVTVKNTIESNDSNTIG